MKFVLCVLCCMSLAQNAFCGDDFAEPINVLRVAQAQGVIVFDKCKTTEWKNQEPMVTGCETFTKLSQQDVDRLQNLPGGYCKSISKAEYIALGSAFVVYGVMGGWIGIAMTGSIWPNAAISGFKLGVTPLLVTGIGAAALIYIFETHVCDRAMRPFVASLYSHLAAKVNDSYVLINVPSDFWTLIDRFSEVK